VKVCVEGIIVVDVLIVAEAGGAEIDPSQLSRTPDALPAILELEVEVLLAGRDVAVREELLAQRLEFADDCGGRLAEAYHHVSAQQKNRIGEGLSVGL
jgi:hypothetical protein